MIVSCVIMVKKTICHIDPELSQILSDRNPFWNLLETDFQFKYFTFFVRLSSFSLDYESTSTPRVGRGMFCARGLLISRGLKHFHVQYFVTCTANFTKALFYLTSRKE